MRTARYPLGAAGLLLAVALSTPLSADAQSTGFDYQGYLTDPNGVPIWGEVTMWFTLLTAPWGGQIWGTASGPHTLVCTNGVFYVSLDFGAPVLTGQVLWLEIEVCQGAGCNNFEVLAPRQGVPELPYAASLQGLHTGAHATPNVIAGSEANSVAAGVLGAVIAGGGSPASPNIVYCDYGFVGGGEGNVAGEPNVPAGARGGANSGTCGGKNNQANGDYSFIGGGQSNQVTGEGDWGAIIGGQSNRVEDEWSVVAGGYYNRVYDEYSAALGGYWNIVYGQSSAVVAGYNCELYSNYGAILSGQSNYLSKNGDIWPDHSVVLGGKNARIQGGAYSLAFGQDVYVTKDLNVRFFESSAWGELYLNCDSSDGNFTDRVIHVGKNSNNGNNARLTRGGAWTNGSSRAFKDSFRPLDGADLLRRVSELDVSAWNCRESTERHIGPCAEDFVALFDVGTMTADGTRESTGLAASDTAGVALVAVQELTRQNEVLRTRLAELEERLARLEQGAGGRP